ncbi:DUF4301 family protein [Aggregatimonas sangjinii]|uniref:DUF4301 family protein n=1 Tax=Aggregatimonas sangjinii TaxID=2583587 RepID=A0A5B7SY82_9FLAO|nr:DUF4301 family protein [Aggregatimonas sangjinii]QCX02199.1 DUF4301 family protein [Aggregatimonas sangjinii]
MMTFSDEDKALLAEKGISEEKVANQIKTFKEGIPFVSLQKAAVIGDGLQRFSKAEENELIGLFQAKRANLSLLKFVPASGAASRMFKSLFNFMNTYDHKKESFQKYVDANDDSAMQFFFENYRAFPFYDTIQARISGKYDSDDEAKQLFVQEMLLEDALNYGFYPKGLLPFHKYSDTVATAFEEHLKEASRYAETKGKAKLHFTISPQHAEMFDEEFAVSGERVTKDTGTDFEISYSFQKPSTDTIAVAMDDSPFRNTDGSLLFRPGGHGALIENLNEQEADIIFIKNIDNVVTSDALEAISDSKKVLGGLLLKVQEQAYQHAERLENESIGNEELAQAKAFLENSLNVRFADDFETKDQSTQRAIMLSKLNRPIRICGMVKNEGEPGGGPFWVKNEEGTISLQIIESAQIDAEDEEQSAIVSGATHFNPVDIVCGVKNHKGEKYDLMDFVDPKQGFITGKTKEGRELKAMELPGLWNGAMAHWNTLFVEVPVATFNPVKTVNDLLRPSHQVK